MKHEESVANLTFFRLNSGRLSWFYGSSDTEIRVEEPFKWLSNLGLQNAVALVAMHFSVGSLSLGQWKACAHGFFIYLPRCQKPLIMAFSYSRDQPYAIQQLDLRAFQNIHQSKCNFKAYAFTTLENFLRFRMRFDSI